MKKYLIFVIFMLFISAYMFFIDGCGSVDGSSASISTDSLLNNPQPIELSTETTCCNSPEDEIVTSENYSLTTLSDAYSVSVSLRNRTNDYYNSTVNWPIQQSQFGICATCSTCGLYGYALYKNTNMISPLYTLFNAYKNPPSGADGNQFYLFGTPKFSDIFGFYQNQGYVLFNGTPSTASSNCFTTLNSQCPRKVINGKTTTQPDYTQLPAKSAAWTTYFNQYNTDLQNYVQITKLPSSLNYVPKTDTQIFPGSSNSEKIKNALDQGYLVLIMFQNLYVSKGNILFSYYTYDSSSGVLSQATPANPTQNNVWMPPTSTFWVGGQHWVYIFSYGTASDGTRMFFVRNSWGNSKTKENGNYYMTDTFLDGSFKLKGETKPNLIYYNGFKIQ